MGIKTQPYGLINKRLFLMPFVLGPFPSFNSISVHGNSPAWNPTPSDQFDRSHCSVSQRTLSLSLEQSDTTIG